jgi:hypothetical protein
MAVLYLDSCAIPGRPAGDYLRAMTHLPARRTVLGLAGLGVVACSTPPPVAPSVPPRDTEGTSVEQVATAAQPPLASDKGFDRGAAVAALAAAAAAAKSCTTAGGPTGVGTVKLTFAPGGDVTAVTVDRGPFVGTSMADCIVSAFRGARVPAFEGPAVSVSKSFSIP